MTHRKKKQLNRVGSLALCLCMLLTCFPVAAFALTEDGLCEHHPEHTEECGYVEGERACSYVCAECAAPEEPKEEPGEEPEDEPAPEGTPEDQVPAPISNDETLTGENAAVQVVKDGTTTYYASFDALVAEQMDSSDDITILKDTALNAACNNFGCKSLTVNAGVTLTLNADLYFVVNASGNSPLSGSGTIAGSGTLTACGDVSGLTISCPLKMRNDANGVSISSGTFSNSVTLAGYFNKITGGTFSGIVNVEENATIEGGTFYGTVNNENGEIHGGTFSGMVNNNGGEIFDGTFSGGVENRSQIYGGTFNCTVKNGKELEGLAMISGGTFHGQIINYDYIWPYEGPLTLGENFSIINYGKVLCGDNHIRNTSNICRLCGDGCTHESWESGICKTCGTVCQHESYEKGKCTVCGDPCPHESYENGKCTVCGSYQSAVLNNGVYEISNASQLCWFAEFVNAGNTAANAVLTADIDLAGIDWTPIGTADKPYTGTFDGGNFTISNFSMTVTEGNNQGLFGAVSGGTVKNFTIRGKIDIAATIDISDVSNIKSISNVGGVVGYATGNALIENVTSYVNITDSHTPVTYTDASGAVQSLRVSGIGGIVGNLNGSTVSGCTYDGTITSVCGASIAGIVGNATNSSTVTHCTNKGAVTAKNNSAHIGGIAGDAQTGTTVSYCINYSNVTSSGGDCIGGIVAYANQNVKIEYCGNIGPVTCKAEGDGFIGGILGYINNGNFKGIFNCFNYGSIVTNEGKTAYAGAILGWNRNSGTVYSSNYYLDTSCTKAAGGNVINDVYSMTAAQFSSGEVAYLLNGSTNAGAWKLTIGTDKYPQFTGKQVYYGFTSCSEEEQANYTNNSDVSSTRKAHNFVDGECSVCHALNIHELSIDSGTITLSEENGTTYYQQGNGEKTAYTGTLKITGSTEENTVTIQNGTHAVIFDGLHIAVDNQIPLELKSGTLNLTLTGENVLGRKGYEVQSILLDSGTALTITAASTGTLYLTNGIVDKDNYSGSPFTAYTRDLIDGDGNLYINGGTIGLQPDESDNGLESYTTGGGIGIQGDLTVSGGSLTVGFIAAKNVKITGGAVALKGLKGLNRIYSDPMVDSNAPSTTHGIFASNDIVISGGAVDVLTEGPACSDWNVYATIKVNQSHALYAINSVTISGGTVEATVQRYGYCIDDFGIWEIKAVDDADDDWGYGIYSKTITITGGNVKVRGKEATNVTPTNGNASVYENVLTLQGITSRVSITALRDISGYGLSGVMTVDTNKLYLYLPDGANITEITAGGGTYAGTLTDRSGTYTYMEAVVAEVSITWGAMSFTYTDGGWNTKTLTYDEGGWIASGNTVKVTNNGTTMVKATVNYTNADGYTFAADWSKKTAEITGGAEFTFTMNLSGQPTSALSNATIGNVTVTLTDADTQIGWVVENGGIQYYENGSLVENETRTIDGVEYKFTPNGVMVMGKTKLDGKWYYFDSMCYPKRGWISATENDTTVWYYGKEDCSLAMNEILEIDGARYYFDADGHSCRKPDTLDDQSGNCETCRPDDNDLEI